MLLRAQVRPGAGIGRPGLDENLALLRGDLGESGRSGGERTPPRRINSNLDQDGVAVGDVTAAEPADAAVIEGRR